MAQPDVHTQDARSSRGGSAYDQASGVTVWDFFACNAPQPPAWIFGSPGDDGWTMAAYAQRLAEWNAAYATSMLAVRTGALTV